MLKELKKIINYRNLSYYLFLPIVQDEVQSANMYDLVKNTYVSHCSKPGFYMQIHNSNKNLASNLVWAINKYVGCTVLETSDKYLFVEVSLNKEMRKDLTACITGDFASLRLMSLGAIRRTAINKGLVSHLLIEAILLKNTKWIKMFIQSTGGSGGVNELDYAIKNHKEEESTNSLVYKLME